MPDRIQEIRERLDRLNETRSAFEESRKIRDKRHEDKCLAAYDHARVKFCENIEDDLSFLLDEVETTRRREQAAERDLQIMADGVPCSVCKRRNDTPCTTQDNTCCWIWRGPQEAGKGENNGNS